MHKVSLLILVYLYFNILTFYIIYKNSVFNYNRICETCSPGTYSLGWNSTTCVNCVQNSNCIGGEEINVNSGYWRLTTNSTTIVACPNPDACLGGYNKEGRFPVNCASGYEGYLCSSCISNGTYNFERVESFVCAECPDPILNGVKVAGLFLLVIIFLFCLITINIKKKGVSQRSVLIRILTNHVQLITLAYAYSMNFPKIITDIFSPLSRVNTSSESVISFDCFANAATLKAFAPSVAIFKIFVSALSPVILFIGALIVFGVCHAIFPKWFKDFKRNLMISMITIVYLLHPTITTLAFGIFQCIKIEDGVSRVKFDLNIECYSLEHLKWCFSLGVPMIVIWVFGFPISGLGVLIKKRKYLDDPQVKRYFIVLFQGYKDSRFFWEFVNVFRKVTLLSINVFFTQYNPVYKGGIAVVIIIAIFRIQLKLNPYVYKCNNELELISSIATGLAIFGGIVFSSGGTVPIIDLLIFFLIIIANFRFFIFWTYLMAKSMEDQFPIIHKLSVILSIILNRKDEDNYNLYEPQSSKPKSSSADVKRKFITPKKIKKKRKNPLLKNDKSEEFKSSNAQAGSSRKLSQHEKPEVIIYMGHQEQNKANEDWDQKNDSEEHKKSVTHKKYKPKVDKSFMSSSSELNL